MKKCHDWEISIILGWYTDKYVFLLSSNCVFFSLYIQINLYKQIHLLFNIFPHSPYSTLEGVCATKGVLWSVGSHLLISTSLQGKYISWQGENAVLSLPCNGHLNFNYLLEALPVNTRRWFKPIVGLFRLRLSHYWWTKFIFCTSITIGLWAFNCLINQLRVFLVNTRIQTNVSLIPDLKGLAQAKMIKKSVILFRFLNMTIWCKHVGLHRLELQIFIIFVLRIYQLG